ncbi:MAG: hypothetical protein DLM69_02925 [Candidatus Chloroheliales bacterium]|nr:MAG: hypothetical protein DLM69_02925 [Chloroflexota bacterium]
MAAIENDGQQVRVNYQAPLWATIAASAVLLVVVGALALISLTGLFNLVFNEHDAFTAIFCGLLNLLLLASVGFFAIALTKGVRDLTTPMQFTNGLIIDHSYRQQRGGGAYWLVLDTEAEAEPAPVMRYIPMSQSKALKNDDTRLVFGANPSAGDADLPAPAEDDPGRLFARNERLTSAIVLRFRVDKPVYESLRLNDRVTVAHSRYLQHVYYVQQWEGNHSVVLKNRSLL